MKRLSTWNMILFVGLVMYGCAREDRQQPPGTVLVIHGGAGTILRTEMTPEREREYREALTEALRAGHTVLARGGNSLDAVEAACTMLEDSPLFNAGKGAVFTSEGKNEMDASIMDGATLAAGAVASVTTIKNPVKAARAVMTGTKHVMLAGRGAEIFAAEQGLEMVEPGYFFTQRRWEALLRAKEKARPAEPDSDQEKMQFGTAAAVALDRQGNLAAATSTGGLTNKMHGRVGDSPIIGAGTYANNATCAVSGTGQGEFFMRGLIAYDISALMHYAGMTLVDASKKVIAEKLTERDGLGGVIAVDKNGNIAMEFNTPGMYRGYVKEDGQFHVYIYGDE